jgi:hypothetical protein
LIHNSGALVLSKKFLDMDQHPKSGVNRTCRNEQCEINPSIIPSYWLVYRDSPFLDSYNPQYIE